jgi:hypothetical protein
MQHVMKIAARRTKREAFSIENHQKDQQDKVSGLLIDGGINRLYHQMDQQDWCVGY